MHESIGNYDAGFVFHVYSIDSCNYQAVRDSRRPFWGGFDFAEIIARGYKKIEWMIIIQNFSLSRLAKTAIV